ncbi:MULTISPECIES: alginate export family protein [unclassified Oleiphilus]|uniref:alginate export family protein n=1 Tax=unclassified Oleiphilus TaxID=2631174 RepID=UPI000ABC6AD1|nr:MULTISPECIES: alginate export family protein [unclassified Oleiphilus]
MNLKMSVNSNSLARSTSIALAIMCGASMNVANASLKESIQEAVDGGKAYGDFRLRYETVDQDNSLKDAKGLTLRTRFGFTTASVEGLSAGLEFEDSRQVLGIDEYNDTNGKNAGVYSVIADPETTEVDQAFLKYKRGIATATIGRQVLTLDNHRFVGHVGWRQDRQTFDAFRVEAGFTDQFTGQYAYLVKRNRIFGEEKDIDSKDHLLNLAYSTDLGKLSAYAYLLEVDQNIDNSLDTYGLRFAGKKPASEDVTILYAAEYATQEKSEAGSADLDADYLALELGASVSGITAKLGFESLGSDEGNYGFSTPLATLHKFNGWADQFLGTPDQGLEDLYVSVGTKVSGIKLAAIYHDFSADVSNGGSDDLGTEVDLLAAKKFNDTYSGGLKYAMYSAGDAAFGKVDTDKAWVWVSAKF